MKTYLCVAAILSVFIVLVQCKIPPILETYARECTEEYVIANQDRMHNLENSIIQCLIACTMKKANLLSDGRISIDPEGPYSLQNLADNGKATAAQRQRAVDCINEANKQGGSECEVADNFFTCINSLFTEMNIKVPWQ